MSGIGNFFKAAVFIFSILTLQLNVFPVLDYIPVKPDLFLVLAVACGIRNSPLFKAVSWGIFLGLLKDIFSIRFFGFNSFTFAVDAFIISLLCRRFYKESLGFNLILLAGAGLLNCLLFSLVSGRLYFVIGMAEAALNCLFFIVIVRLDRTIQEPGFPAQAGE
ncbi:MAG TPA: rod shape-determining protein MreD [Candidatus Omnitrophota bacterium]|nr:rod shape-determining protein MreD [Candidatus Omnitrophota bacterium]